MQFLPQRNAIELVLMYIRCIKNLRGLSPRANYIDRATAACRRSQCLLFTDIGCHVVSVADPLRPYSPLSRPESLLFFQVVPQLYSRG
jgi:hypothetical protein